MHLDAAIGQRRMVSNFVKSLSNIMPPISLFHLP